MRSCLVTLSCAPGRLSPRAQDDSSWEGLVLAHAHAWHAWRFSLEASGGSVARCLGLACLGLRSLGLGTPEKSLSQYKSCSRCDSSASQARPAVDAWREEAGLAEDLLANTGLPVHLLMLVSRLATLRCPLCACPALWYLLMRVSRLVCAQPACGRRRGAGCRHDRTAVLHSRCLARACRSTHTHTHTPRASTCICHVSALSV